MSTWSPSRGEPIGDRFAATITVTGPRLRVVLAAGWFAISLTLAACSLGEVSPHDQSGPTTFGASIDAIVIDDDSPDFTASSSWWSSTSVSGFLGADYLARATAPTSDPAYWAAEIAETGDYEVFARWTAASNRHDRASYLIYADDRNHMVEVDQRSRGGEWVSLGIYRFAAGYARRVALSCWAPEGAYVIADAVRLVPVGLDQPVAATVSYDTPIETGQPTHFFGTSSPQIAEIIASVDGYVIAQVYPDMGRYGFDYSFTNSGDHRRLVINCFDSNGYSIKQLVEYIDVLDSGPYITGVPYFYQYHNAINPAGSCQNTSMAMVLDYYGASDSPDDISTYYGTSQAQSVAGWESVFNSEAAYFGLSVRDSGTTCGSISRLRSLLAAGRPVVVHGYFTASGHVVVLLGFDGSDYIAHDPAGVWSQVGQYGGYSGNDSTGGRYVRYDRDAVEAVIAPDGCVWMHELSE